MRDELAAAWLLSRRPLKVRRPRHLQVAVTNRCDLACLGCTRTDPAYRHKNRDMPVEDFEQLVREAAPQVVTLLGEGDPLLHPHLDAIVRAGAAHARRVVLASSFSVGGEDELLALVRAGVTQVKVSLSSSDQGEYLRLRGRDLFAEVLARIELFAHLWRRERGGRPPVRVEFFVTADGAQGLGDHLLLVKRLGLATATFIKYDPGPAPDENALREGRRRARELGLRTDLQTLAQQSDGRAACALPWLRAYVTVDGRVGPCSDVTIKDRPELGNVGERPFGEIYGGPGFAALRRRFRRGEAPFERCTGCVKGRIATLARTARVAR